MEKVQIEGMRRRGKKKNSPQTTAEDWQSEGECEGNKTKHKVHISETVNDYVNVSERVSGDGM